MENQTYPEHISATKKEYFCQEWLASLFGGMVLRQPTKTYVIQTIVQIISVLQTYFLSTHVLKIYALVLIIPAAINLTLLLLSNCMLPTESKKTFKQLRQFMGLLVVQSLGSASAMHHGGSFLDPIVFFLLFPRDRNTEFGFTEQENYSRAKYAATYLKLMLICTDVGKESASEVIRIIYYCTPILIWLGLYGQFSQFLEYVAEQFNFFMGSSYCYSSTRTYLTLLLNVILIAICIGCSFIQDIAAIIIIGCLCNVKIFNIFGNTNSTKKQLMIDILQVIANVIVIVLCGKLASSYYRELFHVIIPIYALYWVFQFKVPDLVKWHKMIVTVVQCACISMMDYSFDNAFPYRLLRCTTMVRLYSLVHSNPNYLFFEQLVCLIISYRTDYTMAECQLIGFLVQFGIRFLIRFKSRIVIWAVANYKMITVERLRVKHYWAITLFQVIFSHIFLIPLVISCIFDTPYKPFFGIPYFTFSSLRPYRNAPHINTLNEGTQESQIYNQLFNQVVTKVISAQPLWNHYLLKIGKHIGIIQLLEYSGGYAVIQFKGLGSQDTTSCHGEEAAEIERLLQNSASFSYSALSLTDIFNINGYEETKMTLAGIIEKKEFVCGFKEIYVKMLCYFSQELQDEHLKSIVKLSKLYDQEILFPIEFANLIKLNAKFEQTPTEIDEKITQVLPSKIKIKYDDDDCLNMLNNMSVDDPPLKIQVIQQKYLNLQKAILYLYQVSLLDVDLNLETPVNQRLLFELFQSPKYLQDKNPSIEPIFCDIITKAVRAALKLSVDVYSQEGNLQINDQKLIEQLQSWSNCYVGAGSDSEWQSAMQNKVELWSLGFDQQLIIYRQRQKDLQCQLFRFDSEVIRGIEANLQMELVFANNDDQDRYSIQTHEQFFRNMIIEAAEIPTGYAQFYSGPVVISLR